MVQRAHGDTWFLSKVEIVIDVYEEATQFEGRNPMSGDMAADRLPIFRTGQPW